ncbi:glycosyltransferase family 4 protein [Pseudarthrobacter sp. NamB4]|uniref:glycosyltransferase family 4 protein n=1 Tax=Pseudarthrobacter sp. NamB4 TaxID=2576837 RepID=UPI001484D482|nr:glycosyltransferase family 4 protein [Pseudarthrobacter sp. NamB4]
MREEEVGVNCGERVISVSEAPLRLAFLTPWRVDDPAAWSGVVMHMHAALSERACTQVIETGHLKASIFDRGAAKILGQFSSKQYLTGHALATSLKVGKYVTETVRGSGADVVLAVAASQEIAFAKIQQPVVHVTDATFAAMLDYYPLFTRLHPMSIWQGKRMSRRAQTKSTAFSVATHWAKNSLVSDYGLPAADCEVVPFGPRVEPVPGPRSRAGVGLRVLVVASDWRRKGGDKALKAVGAVRLKFPQTTLTVVGNAPLLPDWVKSLGRVPADQMAGLYAEHDVLLELADANAGGVTLTDAHAFGLPVIATDTGGVCSIVAHGESGILISPGENALGEAIAALISVQNPRLRLSLAAGARKRHNDLLNWNHWADATLRICENLRYRAATRISSEIDRKP